jgi:hypothetical protein
MKKEDQRLTLFTEYSVENKSEWQVDLLRQMLKAADDNKVTDSLYKKKKYPFVYNTYPH